MNLDLIIKLVKLANHNPNDNEANAAARKVCKLIAEGQYKFNGQSIPVTPPPVTVRPPSPYKSASNPSPKSPFSHMWTDEDWNFQPSAAQQRYYEEFIKNFDIGYDPASRSYRSPFTGTTTRQEPPKEKVKRPLACTQCKNNINTAYVGNEATFICNTCVWMNYMTSKGDRDAKV